MVGLYFQVHLRLFYGPCHSLSVRPCFKRSQEFPSLCPFKTYICPSSGGWMVRTSMVAEINSIPFWRLPQPVIIFTRSLLERKFPHLIEYYCKVIWNIHICAPRSGLQWTFCKVKWKNYKDKNHQLSPDRETKQGHFLLVNSYHFTSLKLRAVHRMLLFEYGCHGALWANTGGHPVIF